MLYDHLSRQIALAFALFTISSISYAEIRLELPRDTNGIELLTALGASYDETPFQGEDTMTELSPGLAILTDNFYLDIHSISYRFRPKDNTLVKIFGMQDPLPNEEDIPSEFNIKSGGSFDVGLLLEKEYGNFRAGLLAASDVTGTHDGYKVDLSGSYYINTNNSKTIMTIGARYKDQKRSNYLYGVDESEVNNSLNAYNADDEWTAFIGASYSRQLSKNLGLVAETSISSLSKSAQSSPRIKNNSSIGEIELFVGLIWQFSVYR